MKEEFKLSQPQASTLLHRLPLIYRGTRTEAEWLGQLLAREGVATRYEPVKEHHPFDFVPECQLLDPSARWNG